MYLPHGLCWPLFDWARLVGCFSSFELWLCLFGKLSAQARSVELNVLISVIRCLSFHNTKHFGALSTSSRPYRLCLCPVSFIPQDQASPFVHARRGGFILWFSCHLMPSRLPWSPIPSPQQKLYQALLRLSFPYPALASTGWMLTSCLCASQSHVFIFFFFLVSGSI